MTSSSSSSEFPDFYKLDVSDTTENLGDGGELRVIHTDEGCWITILRAIGLGEFIKNIS